MGVDQAAHSRFANLQLLQVCFLFIFSDYDLGRRIETKSLGTSMRTKSKIEKWLQFLRKQRISFCQDMLESVVLIDYEDEDNL
jgi:hypothetical protein